MTRSYQANDLEWEEVPLETSEVRHDTKGKIILATAVVALFALVPLSSRQAAHLANFAKAPKVMSPEEFAAAQAEAAEALRLAEIRRISGLSHSYLPALDYEDPCDAVRRDCCTDSRFPVLGGMDLVQYRLTGQIAFGDPKYSAEIEGISRTYTFWFSDKSFIPVFQSNPEAYLPRFGGFNAGEFCDGGDFSTLLDKTVELKAASEVARHLAFTDSSISDVETCDNKFNSFYGRPTNGVFNTRCVSMRNLEGVPGLLQQMPVVSIPVKMSQLYGVAPQLTSSDSYQEQLPTDGIVVIPVPNQPDSGNLQPQISNALTPLAAPLVVDKLPSNQPATIQFSSAPVPPPPPPRQVQAGSSNRVPSPPSPTASSSQGVTTYTVASGPSGANQDGAETPKGDLPLIVPIDSIQRENTHSQFPPRTQVQDSPITMDQNAALKHDPIEDEGYESLIMPLTSAFSEEGLEISETFELPVEQYPTLPLHQDESTEQEQKYLGRNALTKKGFESEFVLSEMSFPNSEKPLGEKALLKRGLENSSDLSPGLLKQLVFADQFLDEDVSNNEGK